MEKRLTDVVSDVGLTFYGLAFFSKFSFSRLASISCGSPSNAFSDKRVSRLWQSRHKGIYMSEPPIRVWHSLEAVLNVNDAFCLHNLQIAESFLIFSHLGINWMILPKVPRKKVP